MSSLLIRLFTMILVALFSACSFNDEPEIEVILMPHAFGSYLTVIKIQAITDKTTIRDVVINRGNCKLKTEIQSVVELKYGEYFSPVSYCPPSTVREVSITTDNATFTFQFD
jgi:hypothetical protein